MPRKIKHIQSIKGLWLLLDDFCTTIARNPQVTAILGCFFNAKVGRRAEADEPPDGKRECFRNNHLFSQIVNNILSQD